MAGSPYVRLLGELAGLSWGLTRGLSYMEGCLFAPEVEHPSGRERPPDGQARRPSAAWLSALSPPRCPSGSAPPAQGPRRGCFNVCTLSLRPSGGAVGVPRWDFDRPSTTRPRSGRHLLRELGDLVPPASASRSDVRRGRESHRLRDGRPGAQQHWMREHRCCDPEFVAQPLLERLCPDLLSGGDAGAF